MKKMVKKIAAAALTATMAVSTITSATAEFYSKLFQIAEIDRENDVVTAVDCNGMEFQFTEVEDWEIGDFLTAVMDDNDTEEITDDMIVSVRYECIDQFDELNK